MKDLLDQLRTTKLDNRVRLGIMSILVVNDWVAYKELKAMMDLTDGNLASHIKALEGELYLEVKKQFIGKKPHTSYRATVNGRRAFEAHLAALESLLNLGKGD